MQGDKVFSTTSSDMFDSTMVTQGGLPHLMQYLWDKYTAYLQAELEKKDNKVPLDTAKKKAPAIHFAQWATDFLTETRPVETIFIDGNVGVKLTNNDSIAISPGTEIRGTMQESNAIQVTEGKSQADATRAPSGNTLRI
jgi:hypothetical protein